MHISRLLLTVAAVAGLSNMARAADPALPPLGANPNKVSVSGLSSGAFMTVQYGVAFSASTMGMGVVAGGPYNCVYVNLGGTFTCMSGSPAGALSFNAAQGFEMLGQIDPVSNIAAQKIYLFSGTKDTTVKQSVMNATNDFFKAASVPKSHLTYVKTYPAGHAFISPTSGNACGVTAAPFVDECPAAAVSKTTAPDNYDQPQAILTTIYGPLKPKAAVPSSKPVPFDQTEFISSPASSMADTGYVYIPPDCAAASAQCAVHVVFHGCKQGAQSVGDAVYGQVGYNTWADTNGIIVLYPQASISTLVPLNPNGCWDWWGYTGLNFQVQSAVQLSAVRQMVARLTKAR